MTHPLSTLSINRSTRPANILLGAASVALSTSTILACVWPASEPDGIYTLGLGYRPPYALPVYIWLYCLFWWLVQDICKVAVYAALRSCNCLHINDTGELVLPPSTIKYAKEEKERQALEKANGTGGHGHH